ncbi:MAG: transposase [Streptosporangiaceae bacterium]|nr:transposase [Streptosporangiaceae bacterium]
MCTRRSSGWGPAARGAAQRAHRDGEEVPDVLAAAAQDGGLAGRAGRDHAAMESRGVYWWPVYHALAQAGIEVCVCNAAHMRNVPGRKTDLADCQWIAELHEHGLLRPSFIPTEAVAELRARTRYRDREHLIRHHQQARLGYQVTLIPPGHGSPPPSATSQQPAA